MCRSLYNRLDNIRVKLAPCSKACPLGLNCQGHIELIDCGDNKADAYNNKLIDNEKLFPIMTFKSGKLIYNCSNSLFG